MPLNKNSLAGKLAKLKEAIEVLDILQTEDESKFFADKVIQGAATFYMIVAIDMIVDIGNHILTEIFSKPAKTYKDVIISLGEVSVIPPDFAATQADMADFRNKIIHDYDRVDPIKVFNYLQTAPDIFKRFSKILVEFIEKNS